MAIKAPSNRSRKSKTEVQQEFEKIKEQVIEEKRDANPRTEELVHIKEAEIRETVDGITVESVVQKISGMSIEASKAFSDISNRLMTGTTLLSSLREAVALEKKELEKLHKMDITATTIAQMVDEYSQRKATLDLEISETQFKWKQEIERREKEQKEFEENLKRIRTREKEEHEYQKSSERKKDQDQYDEAQRTLERKNKEKQEALEKSWSQREATLKEKEEEFMRLKAEVTQFPERMKKETSQAVIEATKNIELKYKQEYALMQKEAEAEKRLSELKVKSLEESVTRQFSQIGSLQQQLEDAKKQVQDIALKAIEGASGARALTHVNQIAMEQAKTRTTNS